MEVFCLGCGKSLGADWRVQSRKYCSNPCQGASRKKELLEYWLRTGKLKNYTGGTWGNTSKARYVREYLFEQQKGKCAICSDESIHNGLPLKFILDHIDGNSENCSAPNLRLICPNCDSQTNTYKGRNKGNGRKSKGFRIN